MVKKKIFYLIIFTILLIVILSYFAISLINASGYICTYEKKVMGELSTTKPGVSNSPPISNPEGENPMSSPVPVTSPAMVKKTCAANTICPSDNPYADCIVDDSLKCYCNYLSDMTRQEYVVSSNTVPGPVVAVTSKISSGQLSEEKSSGFWDTVGQMFGIQEIIQGITNLNLQAQQPTTQPVTPTPKPSVTPKPGTPGNPILINNLPEAPAPAQQVAGGKKTIMDSINAEKGKPIGARYQFKNPYNNQQLVINPNYNGQNLGITYGEILIDSKTGKEIIRPITGSIVLNPGESRTIVLWITGKNLGSSYIGVLSMMINGVLNEWILKVNVVDKLPVTPTPPEIPPVVIPSQPVTPNPPVTTPQPKPEAPGCVKPEDLPGASGQPGTKPVVQPKIPTFTPVLQNEMWTTGGEGGIQPGSKDKGYKTVTASLSIETEILKQLISGAISAEEFYNKVANSGVMFQVNSMIVFGTGGTFGEGWNGPLTSEQIKKSFLDNLDEFNLARTGWYKPSEKSQIQRAPANIAAHNAKYLQQITTEERLAFGNFLDNIFSKNPLNNFPAGSSIRIINGPCNPIIEIVIKDKNGREIKRIPAEVTNANPLVMQAIKKYFNNAVMIRDPRANGLRAPDGSVESSMDRLIRLIKEGKIR